MDLALLDTDILSEILKQKNAMVLQRASLYLNEHSRFAISAFSRYEVYRGLKDKQATQQLAVFENFCQHVEIVEISSAILDRAAELWGDARRGGHPRYDADLIIASTALHLARALVTGNTAHYAWITALTLEDWRRS